MIFNKPIPFAEALEHQLLKRVLPTAASSAELAAIPAALRARAFFSARTMHAGYLADAHGMITRLVSPETVVDPVTGRSRAARPGEALNPAVVRTRMKQYLASIGYEPDEDKRGGLEDLSSDRRINLIIDTQEKMSRGFGNWKQAQRPGVLAMWPADELYRAESREVPRNWLTRWNNARASLAGSTSATAAGSLSGPFIALKNDPIWSALSRFGNPYPPFDFNSGMRVRDVDADTAERLGVLKPGAKVEPKKDPFNRETAWPAPDNLPPPLLDALVKSLGLAIAQEAGQLILRQAA